MQWLSHRFFSFNKNALFEYLNLVFSLDVENIHFLSPLEYAEIGHLTFYTKTLFNSSSQKYYDLLQNTKASYCFITKEDLKFLPKDVKPIITEKPYIDFIKCCQVSIKLKQNNKIINKSSHIGQNAIIKEGATIGENCYIGDGVYIGENCCIGDNCTIEPNSTITFANIGKSCLIKTGARIGQNGFGFIPEANNFEIPHYGHVLIGNNVLVGANTCIDRGVFDATTIEDNVKIDNLVAIAHNVQIGKNTLIAGCSAIAGSAKIGNYCMLGGRSAVAGHVQLGDFCIVYGNSAISKSFPAKSKLFGAWPAEDHKSWVKKLAILNILLSKESSKISKNSKNLFTILKKIFLNFIIKYKLTR
jgi:UDP-3-O-[3-hydroxymyristoyl] glucosamine N-acyltransferase